MERKWGALKAEYLRLNMFPVYRAASFPSLAPSFTPGLSQKKFHTLSHFKVKGIIRSFILCSTFRVESPVGVELGGELHVWPFHSVALWRAKKEKMDGRTPHSAGWIGLRIRLLCSLIPWVLAEGSVRVVWACTRADRVAQGHRKWNVSVRCAASGMSSLIDSRSLPVST